MNKLYIILICVFLSGCVSALPEEDLTNYKIIVHIRSPEVIKILGKLLGFDHALGLAYYQLDPCEVVVPPLSYLTINTYLHEFRHCSEGDFHN